MGVGLESTLVRKCLLELLKSRKLFKEFLNWFETLPGHIKRHIWIMADFAAEFVCKSLDVRESLLLGLGRIIVEEEFGEQIWGDVFERDAYARTELIAAASDFPDYETLLGRIATLVNQYKKLIV